MKLSIAVNKLIDKNMIKIALVGSACTGKTTVLSALSRKYRGQGVVCVPEAARIVAASWPSLFGLGCDIVKRQIHIADAQLHLELDAERGEGVRVIVLDRCIIDTAIYCVESIGYVPKEVERIYERLTPSYNKLCLFPPKGVGYCEDEVRRASMSMEMRERIHRSYERDLGNHGCQVVEVEGTEQERCDIVSSIVLASLHAANGKDPLSGRRFLP